MQEIMRRFLLSVFDKRSAIIAGYNNSSWELARRLKDNPGMRMEVAGFFDDRSFDRLGMEPEIQAGRRPRRGREVRQGTSAPTLFSSRCPSATSSGS